MKNIISAIIFLCFSPILLANDQLLKNHLLSRSGFSNDPVLYEQLKNLSYEQSVNYLLKNTHSEAQTAPPLFVYDFSRKKYKNLSQKQRMQLNKDRRKKNIELQAWWINEMITTPSPLTESMTLFWHNHFVSSFKKVKSNPYLYKQNELLRRHALGHFSELLHAVAKDPAMLIYLDSIKNKKGKPNENFAREVMELFTLGEGHYSENDIKQAAIAFTGWGVNRNTHTFQLRKKQHDNQIISVLGHIINAQNAASGEQVLDILLQQPATATYLSTKLYKHFISHDDIDSKTIQHLANVLRKNKYAIKPWLKALFLSDTFKNQAQKGTLIKSPIDLIVGTFRSLAIPVENPIVLAKASLRMGQQLFNPPNVKGWAGGTQWINTNTFLIRKNILNKFLREQQKKGMNMMSSNSKQSGMIEMSGNKQSLRQMILDPAYQVK